MRLTIAKGRMYPWCDYTANPLAGRCPNDCVYCYMKDLGRYSQVSKKYSGQLRISWKDLKEPTGERKVRRREDVPFVPSDVPIIFVCSGNDLGMAPTEAKIEILKDCNHWSSYYYVIQSKNPMEFKEVEEYFPPHVIIGTTVETNRKDLCEIVSKAPPPVERIEALNEFNGRYWKMISVEPKLICDPSVLSGLIEKAKMDFVSIGADRGGRHNLPEPNWKSVLELIDRLEGFTRVFKKENLKRLRENARKGEETRCR